MTGTHGLTDQEYFKYVCQDEEAVKRFDNVISNIEAEKREVSATERDLELSEEQVMFAQGLIESIQEAMRVAVTRKGLVQSIERLVQESNFEV